MSDLRLPSGRGWGAAVWDGEVGRIRYLGGFDGEAFLDEVVDIHPGTSEVRTGVATLPRARSGPAAITEGGRVHLFGGFPYDRTIHTI